MRRYAVHSNPSFVPTAVPRSRLVQRAAAAAGQAIVVAAPPGWGKTTLLGQLARVMEHPVVWVDGGGDHFSLEALAAALEAPSASARSIARTLAEGPDCSALMVDNVSLSRGDERVLSELAAENAAVGQLTFVGAHGGGCWPHPASIAVIGPGELALTREECELVERQLLGGHAQAVAEPSRHTECGGCVGLLTAACWDEVGPGDDAVTSWLAGRLSELPSDAYSRVCGLALGVPTAARALSEPGFAWRLHEVVPCISPDSGSLTSLRMRRCLHRAVVRSLRSINGPVRRELVERLVTAVAACGQWEEAFDLMSSLEEDEHVAGWIGANHEAVLRTVDPVTLENCIRSMSLHVVLEHAEVVAVWARALYSLGLDSDAVNKARACLRLADSCRDLDVQAAARVVLADALCRLQRYDEALTLVRGPSVGRGDAARLSEGVLAATVELYSGECRTALERLRELESLANRVGEDRHDWVRRELAEAVACVLAFGGYTRMAGELSVLLPRADAWSPDRDLARGNLGFALMETGRLARAGSMLESLLAGDQETLVAAYGVAHGCVLFAKGECQPGIEAIEAGCRSGARLGWDADTAVNRIYLALVYRAAGRLDEALTAAERAFERLCVVNYMGYRPLAALEVAASLLSLGDIAAARRWVANVEAEGFGENRYHALRAAMILAECDRMEGDVPAAIGRLSYHADHIKSESSNWQMAMYCRAFPGLLGLLAAAVGADGLPVHMLRMVLPEYAERGLCLARGWLDSDEWRTLGARCLGDTGFEMLDRRNGEPICHVRLFGGLDVVVGDRVVASRDWKKGKARLMFAMLVVRRGREVPREQVLEYLWPDLPDDRARNNYYVVWSAMKLALTGQTDRATKCPYVDNKGGRLRVMTDVLRSDIDEFEEALEQARDAEVTGDVAQSLAAYVRLSTVYRGDLLPGDVYDDWFAPLRDHYQREFIDAMARAAELLLERDDPCEALAFARRALAVDPLREDVYRVALRCHIAAGQRSGAIETFLQCRGRLADDLGLDPSAETMALYQEVLVMEDKPRYEEFGLS